MAEQLAAEIAQDPCLDNPGALNCIDEGLPSTAKDRPIPLLILDQEEWESILTQVVDPKWLQTQTEHTIDQFFYVLLDSDNPASTPIVISLDELKTRLAGPAGSQAILLILDAQPDCSVDQLLGLVQLGLGMPASIESLLCRPPDYVLAELAPVIDIFLAGVTEPVPEQLSFTLPETLTGNPSIRNSQESKSPSLTPIRILRAARSVITFSPLLPLLFLALMTLLVVRTVRGFLLWWGISLLTAGTTTLILTVILLPSTNWLIAQLLPGEITSLWISSLLGELGVHVIFNELTSRLLYSIRIPAGLIAAMGLFMTIGTLFVKDRSFPSGNPQVNEFDDLKS